MKPQDQNDTEEIQRLKDQEKRKKRDETMRLACKKLWKSGTSFKSMRIPRLSDHQTLVVDLGLGHTNSLSKFLPIA